MRKIYQAPVTERLFVGITQIMAGSGVENLNPNEYTNNNDDYQGAKQELMIIDHKKSMWDD